MPIRLSPLSSHLSPVVDFHTHVFPEKVAARAVAFLTETYGAQPVVEPTVPHLLEAMDEAGIDIAVTVPVATRPDQVRSINDWARSICSERIVCFGSLHPGMEDPVAEVERVVEMGLKGLKFQPHFQEISPLDERLWPVYEAAEGRLLLLFHSGQEIRPIEALRATPEAYARLLARFPRLTLVLAHLGGYLMWNEVREHLLGRPLYLDTSYCPEESLPDAEMRQLILDHGVSRVLFASDFPWRRPKQDLERLLGLGLSPDEVEAIAWGNAAQLLGLGRGEHA